MKKTTRRQFMTQTLAGVAASALLPTGPLQAQTTTPIKRLMAVFVPGGWDVTWSLDPKPGLTTVDSPVGDISHFGNLPIFTHSSRPAITSFFEQFGNITSVINGIQVRSIAHLTCRQRMFTGSGNLNAPDVGVITGHTHGQDLPVPYLILGNTAFSGDMAGSTARVGFTNQIKALLDPADMYPPVAGSGFNHTSFSVNSAERALTRQYIQNRYEQALAGRGNRGYNRARLRELVQSVDRSRELSNYSSQFGDRGVTLSLVQQGDLALNAIEGGLTHSVLLEDRSNWDTHVNNVQQGLLHNQLFENLSSLVQSLRDRSGTQAGHSMLDETLVVVLSELARTPKLNLANGKDHWPFTSAMLINPNLNGGRTLGGTNDLQEGQRVNMETGEVDENGEPLLPENLLATTLQATGIDATQWLPGIKPLGSLLA